MLMGQASARPGVSRLRSLARVIAQQEKLSSSDYREVIRSLKPERTLTVHEARSGHDLQFTSMVDNGVSMARSIFADNSAKI
ncbi:MAG: hypothetical protein JOZ31_25785 [Verrucomicrobia bacterium]|nr:hypothetical protein [Verrucomicrobiota bacterium]